jgi:ribosomal protein S18 acetylase RimI-like enzyme
MLMTYPGIIFKDSQVKIASAVDIPVLLQLLNSAYRGEASKQGWTSEAHLIAGDVRSDEGSVKKVMEEKGSVLLKYVSEMQEITGCVNLQQHGNKIYLGMFAVDPLQQGGGIGKKLLLAAEEYAKYAGCKTIYMTVIAVRTELIAWYQRHGYHDTGERKPFYEDDVTGKHLQELEFMVLEKNI